MDMLDMIARRIDGEFVRLKGDGREFDSIVLELDQTALLYVPARPCHPHRRISSVT